MSTQNICSKNMNEQLTLSHENKSNDITRNTFNNHIDRWTHKSIHNLIFSTRYNFNFQALYFEL